jgi:hypothetical protein
MKLIDILLWLGGIYGVIAIFGFLFPDTNMFRVWALFSVGTLSCYLIMRLYKASSEEVS